MGDPVHIVANHFLMTIRNVQHEKLYAIKYVTFSLHVNLQYTKSLSVCM